MELVPIVYTALLFVSIMAIIVIAVSYTSYKIRQKKGLVDSPANTFIKPALKIEHSVKKAVERITKPISIPKQIQMETPVNKKQTPPKVIREKTNKNLHSAKHKKSNNISNNRLEVLKPIDTSKKNVIPPPVSKPAKKTNANLQSLGDNLIEKYADDKNSDDMFTLNVDKNEVKKKD